jgi:hypothetical protein
MPSGGRHDTSVVDGARPHSSGPPARVELPRSAEVESMGRRRKEGMRTRLFTGLVVVLSLSSLARSQAPPPVQPSQPSNKQSITIRGCIDGSSIRPPSRASEATVSMGSTYFLKGSKAMMDARSRFRSRASQLILESNEVASHALLVGAKVVETPVAGVDRWQDIDTDRAGPRVQATSGIHVLGNVMGARRLVAR